MQYMHNEYQWSILYPAMMLRKPYDKETEGSFGDILSTFPGWNLWLFCLLPVTYSINMYVFATFKITYLGPSTGDSSVMAKGGVLAIHPAAFRLQRGGLTTAGPPCGSFIFLNMGTSGRTKARPLGGKYQYVKHANTNLGAITMWWFDTYNIQYFHDILLADSWILSEFKPKWLWLRHFGLRIVCRLVLLLLLGFVRCTISLVEQPSSTLMLCFPYIRWFAKLVALFYNWIEARLLHPQLCKMCNDVAVLESSLRCFKTQF